ncbi:MAG: hypothetical protein AAGG38_11085 [Planctomycetota bacterium]
MSPQLAAQTLTGSATVEVQVDAGPVTEELDALRDRLDEAEREREELRRLLGTLGAPPDPPPGNSPETPPGTPPGTPPDLSAGTPADAVSPPTYGSDGFTPITPSADSRVVYVSSSRGSDRNHGLSPDAPLRSVYAGYRRLRHGFPDHLLFFAGDTFAENLGKIDKSGRSAQEPMVFGVYVDPQKPDLPRPIFFSPGESWAFKDFRANGSHLVFRGLHLMAPHRDARRPGFNPLALTPEQWKHSGLRFLGDAQNITVEDCVLELFKFGLVFQSDPDHGLMRNIRLHRVVVADSFGHWDKKIAGHSSGLYAQYIDGLAITDSVFDHNGWNTMVQGAGKTKFNHNLYIQKDCQNVAVRRSIMARGASHGLQLRSGGVVEDCLFVGNALAFYVARRPSVVKDNVVMHSADLGEGKADRRGHGIETLPVQSAEITGNIISQKGGTADFAPAIGITWAKGAGRWLDGRPYRVTLVGNRVHAWPRYEGRESAIDITGAAEVQDNRDNQVDRASGGTFDAAQWREPGRDVAGYAATLGLDASLEAFLMRARQRPRGLWDDRFAAPGVNAYIREGFTAR